MSRIDATSLRVGVAFWLFGLINNIFYVIILTAALDLVGPLIPKASVLLASIIPGLAAKILIPYTIDLCPYGLRVVILVALSTCGMLAVALSDSTDARSIASKIAGIVIANLSAAAGEVNFLSLTHFYGPLSLAAWGSGTGAAGVVGAGMYTLATTSLGFSVHATLNASTVFSVLLLVSYFAVLPLEPIGTAKQREGHYERLENEEVASSDILGESESFSEPPNGSRTASPAYEHRQSALREALIDIKSKLIRTRALIVPYMLPLFLVYFAEYTINQGVAPTLLFPLEESPFANFRSFYPTYGTIYQVGVLVSRSSLPVLRIRNLYFPSLLQMLNLAALMLHALWPFVPSVWYMFVIMFWEGLLGGLVYVSTFAAIHEDIPEKEGDAREFALAAVSMSDSGGIFFASILGAVLETSLCSWQVDHGRDWCKRL